MRQQRFIQAVVLLCICAMLGACSAGNLRLRPFDVRTAGLDGTRSLIVNPIIFDYDNPNLQESSHVCLWTLVPFCFYRQLGRGCNGNAFLLRPAKLDVPERIPQRISECLAKSLEKSDGFSGVRLATGGWKKPTGPDPLVLDGEITECREVGYGTLYGLTFAGAFAAMLVPVIPTSYGNHIKFDMTLELTDSANDEVVWRGNLKGDTKHQIRFFWQVRDMVHGREFDKTLSRFLQPRLESMMDDMVATLGTQ